jgi:hypothetical protein
VTLASLNFRPLFALFWGCSVKTTPHINHNLPDFVVSSYNEPGENSFSEVQSLDVMKNIQGGNLQSSEVAELAKLVTLNVFALTVLALTKNKIISSIFTLPLSCKFLKPLTSLLRHRLMSFLCQKLLQVLFQY